MVKSQLPCAGTHRGYSKTLGDQMSSRTVSRNTSFSIWSGSLLQLQEFG